MTERGLTPSPPPEVPLEARCLTCNYALHSLPQPRCPECGRPFDPSNPWTMNLGRPLGPTAQRILRPARWILYASYLLAWILTLWSTLLPGFQLPLLILLSIGWATVLFGSLLHETLRFITRRIYRQPAPRPNPDKHFLMRGRIACSIAFTLIGLQVPFRLAFAISRPSLERHVMHHYAEVPYDTPLPGPHLCGLLPVHIIRISPTKVTLSIIGGGYLHYLGTDDDSATADTFWRAEHRIAPHWHTSG